MKYMASKKLRQQAVARTEFHIAAQSRHGTQLSIMLNTGTGTPKLNQKEYLEQERARLLILRGET